MKSKLKAKAATSEKKEFVSPVPLDEAHPFLEDPLFEIIYHDTPPNMKVTEVFAKNYDE